MVTLFLIFLLVAGSLSLENTGAEIHQRSFRNHPCNRDCKYGESMECYFSLVVDHYSRLPEQCKNSPDCSNCTCIIGDINKSSLMVVNYVYPGPSLEACSNDTIIVDILNRLYEPTTFHWHGIKQKGTPHMDGVPYITQYPIQPGQTKSYKFHLDSPGSYYYHSHYGKQRANGVLGSLIVRQPKDPFKTLYDVDTTNQIIFITDFAHNSTNVGNILINGQMYDKERNSYPTFQVEKGLRYRFRLAFSGYSQCIVEVSIDKHSMLAISTDGEDLQPINVESILLTSGERYDFVLKANQFPGNYSLRVQGKDSDCTGLHQTAVLHYLNGDVNQPATQQSFERVDLKGVQLNTDFERDNEHDVPIYHAKSLNLDPIPTMPVFQTIYLNTNITPDNTYLMNGISFTLNRSLSLLDTYGIFDDYEFTCDEESLKRQGKDCKVELCKCPHMIRLPYKELIEVVLINNMKGTHPVHLHGYSFYVVGQGGLSSQGDDFNAELFEEIDKVNPFPRNTNHPPMKDTVLVQGHGYTIIRIYTDNPGYWFFHCHIEWHMEVGMALIFKVGENWDF